MVILAFCKVPSVVFVYWQTQAALTLQRSGMRGLGIDKVDVEESKRERLG
jgi:hypothetical protein